MDVNLQSVEKLIVSKEKILLHISKMCNRKTEYGTIKSYEQFSVSDQL